MLCFKSIQLNRKFIPNLNHTRMFMPNAYVQLKVNINVYPIKFVN